MSREVVSGVKTALDARGVDLRGPCGAFAITRRVAWQLRSSGAGLLAKPSGNHCEGFAVDIIAYPDGRIVDILSDAGGTNGPTWQAGDTVDASRYRAPIDPGDPSDGDGGSIESQVENPPIDLPAFSPSAFAEIVTGDLGMIAVTLRAILQRLDAQDQNLADFRQEMEIVARLMAKATVSGKVTLHIEP